MEHKEYVGAQSTSAQEENEQDGATLMEEILSRDNLNSAYKRVECNHGAAGIDGIIQQAIAQCLQTIFGKGKEETDCACKMQPRQKSAASDAKRESVTYH